VRTYIVNFSRALRAASLVSSRATLRARRDESATSPGETRAAFGVDRREHEAPEHPEVLEEVDLLLLPQGWVALDLPIAVRGQGRRDEAAGEHEGGQPWEPAEREQEPRPHLCRAVDPDQLGGVLGQDRHVCRDRQRDVLRGSGLGLRVLQRIEPADDEHRGEQGTGQAAYDCHGGLPARGND